MRLAVSVFLLALFACGGSDPSGTGGGSAADAPPVSSAGKATASPDTPAAPAPAAAAAAPAPEVTSCLGLVRQAQWSQAVDACLAALDADPGNADVQAALDQAKTETAKLATAEAAGKVGSDAAAGAAQDAATSKLGEAAGGVKLGE